jgi:malate synthase
MNTISSKIPAGVQILGDVQPAFAEILTPDALAFVAKLQRGFGLRREECLQNRQARQAALDREEALDFLPETKQIRDGDWICAQIPRDLLDRRVEASSQPSSRNSNAATLGFTEPVTQRTSRT